MKSKFKFFGIVALISVASFTVQSCAKDFSEDIDALKAQIAAAQASITSLQSAINAGKLVKTVTTVTNGYTITFSDNTSITITNGATGATGATGSTGATGATGFTPIIGIDAQGYWTVIASQGAAATRILVGGNPVLAKVTAQNLTLGTDNYLYIDGVKTTCYVPNIAYNATTRRLMVWVKDPTTGVATLYEVPLASDVVLVSDIIGLVPPVSAPSVLLNYGLVVASTPAQTSAEWTWSGLTLGQLLYGTAKVPVIVNPANATVAGYTFEIITTSGDPIAIQGTLSAGWTGSFTQIPSGDNGLYTLTLNPTAANITSYLAASYQTGGLATQLAIRATKDTRSIISGYQYTVKVQNATQKVLPAATTNPLYVQIPSTKDLLTNFTGVVAADFYKLGTVINSSDANVTSLISSSTSSSSISVVQGGTSEDINSYRNANVTLKAADFTGKHSAQSFDVKFYTPLTLATVPSYSTSYVIGGSNPAKINLASLFTALDGERKLELWRARATGLTTSTLPAGITATFYKADGTTTTTSIADVQYVAFTFTNATVVPTTGTTVYVQFTDSRPEVSGLYTPFKVPVSVVVSNPTTLPSVIANIQAAHIPTPLWSGQMITLYGNANNHVDYTMTDAYIAGTFPISNYTYAFKEGTTTLSSNVFPYTAAKVNVNTDVKLYVYPYGNTNNPQLVETVQVKLLSEIQQGTVVATQTAGVDNFITVTHGSTAWTYFNTVYSLKDYLANTINAFNSTNPDVRLAANPNGISVAASGTNAGLIDIENNEYTSGWPFFTTTYYGWRVRSHFAYDDPILTVASVDVPVTITITDDYGKTLVKTVFVRVVKP